MQLVGSQRCRGCEGVIGGEDGGQGAEKAAEVGIKSTVIRLSKNVSENNLLKVIDDANADISVNSILVQLPLPNHINSNKVIDRISIEKDVDGFNSKNIGLLALGRPKVIPCTPLGCYKMLESILDLEGKKVRKVLPKTLLDLVLSTDKTLIY